MISDASKNKTSPVKAALSTLGLGLVLTICLTFVLAIFAVFASAMALTSSNQSAAHTPNAFGQNGTQIDLRTDEYSSEDFSSMPGNGSEESIRNDTEDKRDTTRRRGLLAGSLRDEWLSIALRLSGWIDPHQRFRGG